MASTYSDDQRRLAVIYGVGSLGYLMALFTILVGSGGVFWFGVAWLAVGVACSVIMFALRNRLFGSAASIKEWLAFPGWGGLLIFATAVGLGSGE
ncbi:MAG TPA: hypothetical protein VHD84_03135 [Candidatus Saccharimonadales bacterium]|nr:hypothetical protein [Candidatus Saccharimonadales bacterium]